MYGFPYYWSGHFRQHCVFLVCVIHTKTKNELEKVLGEFKLTACVFGEREYMDLTTSLTNCLLRYR